MQKIISICVALLLFFWTSVQLNGQDSNLFFHKLSAEGGLPQSSVNAIVQDNLGFMWFGTEDGLARYDGYTFQIFRNSIADSTTISNNFISSLMAADDGTIWVGTRDGLSVYRPETDQFTSILQDADHLNALGSLHILSILQSRRGNIYVGTNKGLIKILIGENKTDLTFEQVKQSFEPGDNEIFNGVHHDITEDAFGGIWFASQGKDPVTRADNGALTCYNPSQDKFTHYYHDSTPYGISSNAARSLYTSGRTLWLGTIDGGVNKISLKGRCKISEIQIFKNDEHQIQLPHNFVSKIISDGQSKLWVGTYEGLVSSDIESIQFEDNNIFEELASTIPPNIHDLFIDNAENLWVATDKGLYVHYSFHQAFTTYTHDPDNTHSIAAGDIFGILEDSDGHVWAVSYGTGLSTIRTDSSGSKRIIRYTPNEDNPVLLPTTQLLGITEDENRNIWLASFDGLLKISKTSQTDNIDITHYSPDQLMTDGEPRKYYTRIFTHPNGSLWIRTYQNGIDIIESSGNDIKVRNLSKITVGNSEEIIRTFSMDESGNLWIATDFHLFRSTVKEDGNLLSTPVILNNVSWNRVRELDINYILETDGHNIWIGTSNGLVKLSLKQITENSLIADFKIYTESDGLPNNTVYAIAADEKGRLWLSTNKGLSRFGIEDESFTNFLLEGGPALNEFNEGTVAKGKDGHLYFGGIGGMVQFHPDSILLNPFVPPVVITDVRVMNESVPPGDERIFFSKDNSAIEEIILPHTDDFLTLHFSALNFNQPERNEYAYKLHGFHDEWINSGNQRQATFTNLDHGEYLFQVIGSNNDGIWNEAGASLRIIILPPFWQTWYAYTFYILAFFLAGTLLLRQRIRAATKEIEIQAQIERAKHEERERFRKKTSQDFHDEAGNKITKINLFTELAKAEAENSKELSDFLKKIEINTRELSAGMRDFIWTMDPEKDTLFDTLMRLKDFGQSMFHDSGIEFKTEGLSSIYHDIKLPMDTRRTILLIFKEAMNNCAKYANAKRVILGISVENEITKIRLKDDGIGFNPADKMNQKGYGTKIMRDRAEKIDGKLTIDSIMNCGTEVKLTFNLPHIGDTE